MPYMLCSVTYNVAYLILKGRLTISLLFSQAGKNALKVSVAFYLNNFC